MHVGLISYLLTETASEVVGQVAGQPEGLFMKLYHANVFTLIVFVGLIIFLVKKFNVGGLLQESRDSIAREIAELEKSKIEAQRQLELIKARTENLTVEIDQILTEAKTSAGVLSAQIIDQAQADAGRLIETAKKRIVLEQKAAARQLEARLLHDALQDARLELARQTDHAAQSRSVEDFIQELSQQKIS